MTNHPHTPEPAAARPKGKRLRTALLTALVVLVAVAVVMQGIFLYRLATRFDQAATATLDDLLGVLGGDLTADLDSGAALDDPILQDLGGAPGDGAAGDPLHGLEGRDGGSAAGSLGLLRDLLRDPQLQGRTGGQLDDLDGLLDDLLGDRAAPARPAPQPRAPQPLAPMVFPQVDLVDTGSHYHIVAAAAGARSASLDVRVEGQRNLVISGTVPATAIRGEEAATGDVVRDELQTGPFTRVVPLPGEVKPDSLTYRYEDGLIRVAVAKEKAQITT